MAEYVAPEQFYGKTLRQLRGERSEPFRSDILGGYAGISEDVPLSADMYFNAPNDPGSGEVQFLQRFFTPGAQARQTQANQQAQTLQQQAVAAVQPAVNTLQSGIDPLKQKYQSLIESIRGKGVEAKRQAEIGATQEFAKRGLLPSSGNFGEFLQGKTLPIETAFSGLEAETGLGAQNAEQSILNAMANLQAQGGLTGFSAGEAARQAALTLAEQQRQFDTGNTLAQQQLAQQLEIAKMGGQSQDRYTTLSEGQTLFDLLSGNSIFTAPKTYKPGGLSGGLNNPAGI